MKKKKKKDWDSGEEKERKEGKLIGEGEPFCVKMVMSGVVFYVMLCCWVMEFKAFRSSLETSKKGGGLNHFTGESERLVVFGFSLLWFGFR